MPTHKASYKYLEDQNQKYLYLVTCSACPWQGRTLTESLAKEFCAFHEHNHAYEADREAIKVITPSETSE